MPLAATLALIAALCGPAPAQQAIQHSARDSAALFHQAWLDVWENYSYLAYKNVDWRAVYRDNSASFDRAMTPDEFALALNQVLSLLHDWHVAVQAPGGEWLGFGGSYDCNYPSEPMTRYLAPGQAYVRVGGGVVTHALLEGDVAYIRVDSLETERWASVGQTYVDSLVDRYLDAAAVIIDIRANNGGNEEIAASLASRFTDQERVYGYVRRRIPGQDPMYFSDYTPRVLEPRGAAYAGPVACLVGRRCLSSAEWFALMLRACPNAVLVGDRTRGGTGNPRLFTLDNGVSYTLSSWVGYDAQGHIFEDQGLEPDIYVSAALSVAQGRDLVLERALSRVLGRDP